MGGMRASVLAVFSFLVLLGASSWDGFYDSNRIRGIREGNAEPRMFGRLASSQQRGPLADAALLGLCHAPGEKPRNDETQESVFHREGRCPAFERYRSKPGGGGLLYYAVSALGPEPRSLRLFAAILFSGAVAGWLLWVYAELGLTVALLLLATLTQQQWLVRFGDNVGLSIGTMLLPLVLVSWLKRRGAKGWRLGSAVYAGAFACFLVSGAEFVFAVIASTPVPVAYYGVRDREGARRTLREALLVGGASVAAALSAGGVLLVQLLALPRGSLTRALQYVMATIERRTYDVSGRFEARLGVDTPLSEVLTQYLAFDAMDLGIGSVSFLDLLILLLVATLASRSFPRSRDTAALVATSWASLLGPLSWLVICKSHAAAHPFMDPLVWYLPFGLFAWAACCGVLVDAVASAKTGRRSVERG